MNTTLTSNLIDSSSNADTTNERTEVEIKVKVVLVNGTVDMPASLESFRQRMAKWVVENEKAATDKMNEKRVAELTDEQKIAETSAKVLSLYGNRYAPRDLYMSQLLCSLTTVDGATALHPDLYQPVRMAVEAWLKGQKESGKILISKGKSGGVKAADSKVASDLAQAAE